METKQLQDLRNPDDKIMKQVIILFIQIIDAICNNDFGLIKNVISYKYDFNFKCEYSFLEFDQYITPLVAISCLDRIEILKFLLSTGTIKINLPTEPNC